MLKIWQGGRCRADLTLGLRSRDCLKTCSHRSSRRKSAHFSRVLREIRADLRRLPRWKAAVLVLVVENGRWPSTLLLTI
jgi:hypothetical protein